MLYFYGWLDKAPRPSISNVIWVLSSDTDTICQLNQLFSNSEVVMLSILAMPINSTLKFHLKGFVIFFNYQIKRIGFWKWLCLPFWKFWQWSILPLLDCQTSSLWKSSYWLLGQPVYAGYFDSADTCWQDSWNPKHCQLSLWRFPKHDNVMKPTHPSP